jgi:hypothetical protein
MGCPVNSFLISLAKSRPQTAGLLCHDIESGAIDGAYVYMTVSNCPQFTLVSNHRSLSCSIYWLILQAQVELGRCICVATSYDRHADARSKNLVSKLASAKPYYYHPEFWGASSRLPCISEKYLIEATVNGKC